MNDGIHILHGNTLQLGEGLTVTFQRTLRIPDDGKRYPLPPGLGAFPLRRVGDYLDRVPEEWRERGGVFLPMYQREAMWLAFSGTPHALKIGVGKVCAISGERWAEGLRKKPQNYVVPPHQPWLDGIASGRGTIRQFVAMPLGLGYTVEGQVTGEEREGGIQLQAFPPKPGAIPPPPPRSFRCEESSAMPPPTACAAPAAAPASAGGPDTARRSRSSAGSMGLAAGGRMTQKIYPDPYGLEAWDLSVRSRVFVHIVNSELWREITGEEAPATPVTAKSYASAGLPWFALYDEAAPTLEPTAVLAGVKSVNALDAEKSTSPLQDDGSVQPGPVKGLWHKLADALSVDDGKW